MSEIGFAHVTPILCVQNVAQSLEYYDQVLGFEVAWQWSDERALGGGQPTFACVCRGQVSLFLAQQRQGNPGTWVGLYLETLDEVDALHREYRSSGAKVVEPPTDCSWGMREMRVEDLDGNTFRIGSQLPES